MTKSTSVVRTKIGKVTSNKMNKTVVVEIERTVKHEKYGKMIKKKTKLHAHDENQTCKIGDFIKIRETRPISKLKSWAFVEVIS